MQQSLLHQPSKLFCVFCVFRGNICSPTDFTEFTEQTGRDVLPQNSEFTEQTCRDVLPQNSQNSQNRLAEDVLPQISQMHTDVVFLEFCEFCVFCGTSHAPVNLCKSVQSVGGLFRLRGSLLCWCLLLCWCTSCSGKRQSRAETSAPPIRPRSGWG